MASKTAANKGKTAKGDMKMDTIETLEQLMQKTQEKSVICLDSLRYRDYNSW